MPRHGKLPRGLFYTPSSDKIYFKIKRWDDSKGAFVWSSPQSSRTSDIAVALRTKEEAQKLSDKMAGIRSDTKLCHRAAYDMVNTILKWHSIPELPVPTWSACRDKWLETERSLFLAKKETRPGVNKMSAYNQYISRLKQFDSWLDGDDPMLAEISKDDAQMFYSDMLDFGYRSSTIIATIKILRRIFREAVEEGYIKKNPWLRIKTIGNHYRQNDPFSIPDIRKIWKHLDQMENSEEWYTACLFGIAIGARIKDCSLRSWDEIILDSKMPHIVFSPGKTLTRRNRHKHDVEVPLVDPLLSHLRKLERSGQYLTPKLAEKPTDQLSNAFSALLREIDIPMRVEEGVKTWYSKGFHSFRHTIPTLLAANGVPDEIRMEITGHSDSALHHQYTHHDDAKLRKHLEDALSGLPELVTG